MDFSGRSGQGTRGHRIQCVVLLCHSFPASSLWRVDADPLYSS